MWFLRVLSMPIIMRLLLFSDNSKNKNYHRVYSKTLSSNPKSRRSPSRYFFLWIFLFNVLKGFHLLRNCETLCILSLLLVQTKKKKLKPKKCENPHDFQHKWSQVIYRTCNGTTAQPVWSIRLQHQTVSWISYKLAF